MSKPSDAATVASRSFIDRSLPWWQSIWYVLIGATAVGVGLDDGLTNMTRVLG